MVDREKVSFSVETINKIHGLPNDEVEAYLGHQLINAPTQGFARIMLKKIVWLDAEWKKIPMGRLQLYPHQLTTESNVWLFFIKKKILPTRHDSAMPFDYAMLLYSILMKQAFNLGYLMQGALFA
uniref:Uncharacterized protein n=1 Tax=Cucumis melo TaxID=3656 RepID=A0A9I9DSV8_CUCME